MFLKLLMLLFFVELIAYASGSGGDDVKSTPASRPAPERDSCREGLGSGEDDVKSTPAPDHNCGEDSLGYEFSNRTGRCYKFHTHGLIWTETRDACVKEGALLAVANSRNETEVLVDIFKRYPVEMLSCRLDRFWISVGIYKEDDVWKTVDGNTPVEWKGEWPIMSKLQRPYMFMYRDGRLISDYNSIPRPYICEKASAR